MNDAHVAYDEKADGSNAEKDGREGAHDQYFVTGDAHMPQWKVYHVSKMPMNDHSTYTTR
jgi:hypothetical protein